MRRRTFLRAVPLPWFVRPTWRGDEPEAPTPEAVARKALDAAGAGRFDEFARAMDAEALKTFRKAMLGLVDLAADDGKEGQLLPLFPGVKDVKGLKTLDAAAFFAAYLRGVERQNPSLRKDLAGSGQQVLGRVDEREGLAHVVYRRKPVADGVDHSGLRVISLKRAARGWGMTLRGDVESMIAAMKAAYEARRRGKPAPEAPGPVDAWKVEVLGRVDEGEGVAHVVYRVSQKVGEATTSRMNAYTLKAGDEGWGLLRKRDKAGLAKYIQEHPAPNP